MRTERSLAAVILAMAVAACNPPSPPNDPSAQQRQPALPATPQATQAASDSQPLRCAKMTANESRGQDCDYAADILDFIDDRALCEHFLGEPDFDAARRQDLQRAVADTCTGLDKRLTGLRTHHSADANAMRLLLGFQTLGY